MTGGHWIAASKALGRLVATTETYPHICGRTVAAEDTVTGRPVRLGTRNCAACAHEKHLKTHPLTPTIRRQKPMHSNESLRDVALSAAVRGWHVFPLRPDDKRPAFPDHDAEHCTGTDPRCRGGASGLGAAGHDQIGRAHV